MNLGWLYLFVLAEHALYAAWLIRSGRADLAVGRVRSTAAILVGLVFINGFSVICFAWPEPAFVMLNASWHVLLLMDEVFRLRKTPVRWVFAVNHVFFVGLLVGLLR